MPRIDPKQLLDTLRPLITASGGIKGEGEVVKLAQLMQRFSKKLVSKVIYVQILKSTEGALLDAFLGEKGWELLNAWFSDAIRNQNWELCQEMIQLFSDCPISAERLKENVADNHAPRLIDQLRQEPTVDENIRSLAEQVYSEWVGVVSPPTVVSAPAVRTTRRGRPVRAPRKSVDNAREQLPDSPESEDGDDSDTEVIVRRPTVRPAPPKPTITSLASPTKATNKADNKKDSISLLQSLAEEVDENIKKEEIQKKAEAAAAKKRQLQLKQHKTDKEKTNSSHSHSKDSKSSSSSKSSDSKHSHSGKSSSHSSSSSGSKRSSSEHSSKRDRESKRSRHYDPRDEVDDAEKQRIKEMARRLREETQKEVSSTGSLGKIPKIPKKVDAGNSSSTTTNSEKDKKGSSSFAAMLGVLDKQPKNVKISTVKNKSAAMLEGMSKSPKSSKEKEKDKDKDKEKDKERSKKDHHHSSRDHHHSSSHRSDRHSRDSPKFSSKDSKSSSSSSRRDHESSSKKLHMPSESKSSSSSSHRSSSKSEPESPKLKSPSSASYTESNGFMDAILGKMGGTGGSKSDAEKRRKRRNSDRENNSSDNNSSSAKKANTSATSEESKKEDKPAPKAEPEQPKQEEPIQLSLGFFRDTLDTSTEDKDNKESEEDIKKEEKTEGGDEDEKKADPVSDPPMLGEEVPGSPAEREVRGILVYHRGRDRRNKSIRWKADSEIVAIKYFELDEGERINVNKVKFETMRNFELNMEKAALKQKDNYGGDGSGPERTMAWYPPVKATFEGMKEEDMPCLVRTGTAPGSNSAEVEVQAKRELGVLQVMYFKKDPPTTPAEVDAAELNRAQAQAMDPEKRPAIIPLDDQNGDDDSVKNFTAEGWPSPKTNEIDQQANIETAFSLPPALSNLLSTIGSQGLAGVLPPPGSVSTMNEDEQAILQAQTEALLAMQGVTGGGGPPGGSGNAPAGFSKPAGGPPPSFNHPPPSFNHPPPFHQPPPFGGHQGGPPGPHQPHMPPHQGPPPHGQEMWGGNNGYNSRGNGNNHFRGGGGGGGGGNHNNRGYGTGDNRRGNWDNPNGFQRGGGNNGAYRNDRNRGGGCGGYGRSGDDKPVPNRPCKYWMEKGWCNEGNGCRYPHPPQPPRN